MTTLKPFEEPIERSEFIQHYMELFTQVVKQTYQIDEFYPKEKGYLLAEEQKIALLYDYFTEKYHRAPDYSYLSDTLTTNFLAKEHLFSTHQNNLMSAEHFATLYIDQLKRQQLCTAEQFAADFFYILDREHYRALSRYNEQNQAIAGYPELQIQNNTFLQQQLLKELIKEFPALYQAYSME